ncbi:hypothetical protein Tco_0034600, partial [Tanacetum coccineum]
KTPQDSASKQPKPATKRAPPKKPTTTTLVKPTKTPSSKQPKSPTKKPSKRKLPQKVRKGKPSFQLVDEDDEAQQESVPQGESDDPALELAKKMNPGKAHEALAGPDPEPMQEDQTGSDSGKVHVSLAGPNPEHVDDEFLATAYSKVHENLKLITNERVIEDNPESHFGSMSSMKNLEDTDNFGDQFLYDKPTEDDQEKSKVVDESDSTIPDPSHQTVTSTHLVIAPVTDFLSPKPSLLVTPSPINTEATNCFAFRDSF